MTIHTVPDPKGAPVPPVARPKSPAHVITTEAEAIGIAQRLAADFRKGASDRDRNRAWPVADWMPFPKAACGRSTCRAPLAGWMPPG